MPNGESKNWIRFQLSLESFRGLYNHWPTKISVYSFFIEELKEKFSSEDFNKINSKIKLIPDDDHPFLCCDDLGNKFDYSRDSSPKEFSNKRATDWLEVEEPNYYD